MLRQTGVLAVRILDRIYYGVGLHGFAENLIQALRGVIARGNPAADTDVKFRGSGSLEVDIAQEVVAVIGNFGRIVLFGITLCHTFLVVI